MATETEILQDQIITGPLFNEPMRVVIVRPNGPDSVEAGLEGLETSNFRRVTLTSSDIASLKITEPHPTFEGDGNLLRLGLQAYSMGIAHEFDPYFGLSISRVDPLPHQLEAVYEYFMKLPSVRFLLADDAGAGKTIMAGLLVRELKLRGLAERILVVCPANLTFQWQRELFEKFDQSFHVLRGSNIRDQFGMNQWLDHNQIITSLDLAKRDDILAGLKQATWDLVIIDEAHRMSARDESHKSQRYRLGELLRDSADNILLLTATPHKGDPQNFTLFLQLLDQDVYADVKSIQEAMQRNHAPFYLRRTKEAMVYFPERQEDGSWTAMPVFTKRIPRTADFNIEGDELELYKAVTDFVKRQSRRAAGQGEDRRAQAIGFLMSMYQRRLASSSRSMKKSLENRARRLEDGLAHAQELVNKAPPILPDPEDIEEMDDHERERLEELLDAITLAGNADEVRDEITELQLLAVQAAAVEESGTEAKLHRLHGILQEEGFFDDPDQRLLIFTEFRDTLDYLMEKLQAWGFRAGNIHGGMNPGSREEPGTRIYVEQQFKDGDIQVLVATEAAGEGINLQCCHILFNFDIPWNPNRLEQRMGRIHRYGQRSDCLIFNFVATNTIEGKVLERLLSKLQEIRDALDDDSVFNVIGEILPATQVERVLRDYYAGRLGDADLEDRLLKDVDEKHFRDICQTALEGLASKKLNLDMLVERRAKAQERRIVPETISRFLSESAKNASLTLRPVNNQIHTFDPGPTPAPLKRHELSPSWNLSPLLQRYPRLSTERATAEENHLEWVTPGHPLFEALRRTSLETGRDSFGKGACFYSLGHETPARMDFYRAKVTDGLGQVIHERLFTVELLEGSQPVIREPEVLGDLMPADRPGELPPVVSLAEPTEWLHQNVFNPFLDEVKEERIPEVNRVSEHVEISLTEVIGRADLEIGRAEEEIRKQVVGAEGRRAQAENRHSEVLARRGRRRQELTQQRSLTLQGVEKLTSILVLPHPGSNDPEVKKLRSNTETEMTAMRVVMEHERAKGKQVYDVHERNLGYDVTSLDLQSGELRLIEIKGLAAETGTILLTPNERRVAEDRRDCYWLYIVTNCAGEPVMQEPIQDPAKFPWHEVSQVQHYWLQVDAMTKPMKEADEQR